MPAIAVQAIHHSDNRIAAEKKDVLITDQVKGENSSVGRELEKGVSRENSPRHRFIIVQKCISRVTSRIYGYSWDI